MLCTLARWQITGALDREGERPPRCAAHVASCARCQGYARRLEALHERLAAGAPGALPPVARAARRRVSRPLLATGALAVAAGAALVYFWVAPAREPARVVEPAIPVAPERRADAPAPAPVPAPPAEKPAPPRDSAPAAPRESEIVARADEAGAARSPASPARRAVGRLLFTAPRPLRAELDALAADGRRGALAILELGGVRRLAQNIR
jgi:hypothetical protein